MNVKWVISIYPPPPFLASESPPAFSLKVAATDSWILATTLYGMHVVFQNDADLRCKAEMRRKKKDDVNNEHEVGLCGSTPHCQHAHDGETWSC